MLFLCSVKANHESWWSVFWAQVTNEHEIWKVTDNPVLDHILIVSYTDIIYSTCANSKIIWMPMTVTSFSVSLPLSFPPWLTMSGFLHIGTGGSLCQYCESLGSINLRVWELFLKTWHLWLNCSKTNIASTRITHITTENEQAAKLLWILFSIHTLTIKELIITTRVWISNNAFHSPVCHLEVKAFGWGGTWRVKTCLGIAVRP